MLIGNQVRLEIGGILIGSSTNLNGNIRFSLVEETPTMLTKYVELYFNELSLFTAETQAFPSATTSGVTHSFTNSQINQVENQTITFTAPSNFFSVMY